MTRKILYLALLLSISLNAFSGQINVKKLHKAKWMEVSSENFTVITDAKEKDAHAMARELEQFRYFMALLLGYKQYEVSKKIPVILTKDNSTYTAMGIPSDYVGFFVRRDSEFVIFANSKGFSSASSGRSSFGRQVVLHELTHLLINNASIGLADPPWYSEGIAEYFGTYVERKGQVILGDLTLLKNRFYSLLKPGSGQYESMDTESLFKTTELPISANLSRKEEMERARFYARSVVVVHYLNADPVRRKNMFIYLRLINEGYSVDEAFNAVFQMTFADLDEALDKYISGKFVYGRVFNIGPGGVEYPEVKFTARPLDPRAALELLVPRIAMIGGGLLEDGSIEAMYQDIEKLYPDFFASSP